MKMHNGLLHLAFLNIDRFRVINFSHDSFWFSYNQAQFNFDKLKALALYGDYER